MCALRLPQLLVSESWQPVPMPPSAPARSASCRPILVLAMRGGLSNQKECLINAAIAAHALNATLALPHFDLIGSGNEKFEPSNPAYVGPYADRRRWGHFGHLFNASLLTSSFKGTSLSLLHRVRTALGPGRPLSPVELPPVENLTRGCTGYRRHHGTCEPMAADSSLLELMIRQWGLTVRLPIGTWAHSTPSLTLPSADISVPPPPDVTLSD